MKTVLARVVCTLVAYSILYMCNLKEYYIGESGPPDYHIQSLEILFRPIYLLDRHARERMLDMRSAFQDSAPSGVFR